MRFRCIGELGSKKAGQLGVSGIGKPGHWGQRHYDRRPWASLYSWAVVQRHSIIKRVTVALGLGAMPQVTTEKPMTVKKVVAAEEEAGK
jgi:hypothetical protein